MSNKPTLATKYVVNHHEQTINGEQIPWHMAEEGPLVEAIEDVPTHILWLPILVDAPMPTPPKGRPSGEPIGGTDR